MSQSHRSYGSRARRIVIAALAVVALLTSAFAVFRTANAPVAHAATPEVDVVYANGETMYMIGPHLITGASPQELAQSAELYVLVFPLNSNPTCASNCPRITLPSGYQPQCDPCFHPGLPPTVAYHDHVLSGAPGFGTDGTAGDNNGPWQIIVMTYKPSYVMSPNFKPITRDEDLDAAIAAGDFLPIGSGSHPYQIFTGNILICPVVSSHV